MPLDRIAIVGASVSAGFGGTPFGDAFTRAAPRSAVQIEADVALFRDPIGNTRAQLDHARAFHPTVVVAIDLLFWDVYGAADDAWRSRAVAAALAELDAARTGGAWIVVGDVPLITTAAEWMLSRDRVPAPDALAAINAELASWAKARDHVLVVPLAAWTEPLRTNGSIELGGESRDASELMSFDGLHPNALGDWYLLDKLDRLIEERYPGTPKDALAFTRP